jgi:anti-anti-sigma factor
MATVPMHVASGPVGEFSCDAPWQVFQLSPTAAALLGLGSPTLTLAEINTGPLAVAGIRYDVAIAETLRTGEPLVVTHRKCRPADGAVRTFTTVTEVHRDHQGEPVRLQGCFVDITDDICRGEDLDDISCMGIVECGHTSVVVLSGDVDITNRAEFTQTIREAVARGGRDVYIDARHVRFCEARAVSTLVDAADRLGPRRRLIVLNPSRILRRVLALTALGRATTGTRIEVRRTPGVPHPG